MTHDQRSRIRGNFNGTTVELGDSAAQKPMASRALRTGPVAAEFYDINESSNISPSTAARSYRVATCPIHRRES